MRLVLLSFVSLDGVYQGPGSPDEDRSEGFERGGWLVPFVDEQLEETVTAWSASATGFLFGRRTYEEFSAVWPTITDPSDANAARLNRLPKIVVTTSRIDLSWGPVTVIGDDVAARVAAIKRAGDGELQVHGSGRLARSLLELGLVDELRIVTAPVVVGAGRTLFAATPHAMRLELLSQDRTATGLTMSRFRCAGAASAGAYKRGETNLRAAER